MSDCIEFDTPGSILDKGNSYYPAETDIFAAIFDMADGTYEYEDAMRKALWHAYRYRIIGSCDTPEWVQAMADRLDLIGPKYEAFLTKAVSTDLTDLSEASYERITQHTPMNDTDGDVRTYHREHETLPENLTGTTKYLDAREDDTDTFTPNTQDRETYTAEADLASDTFARMMDRYPDILIRFVDEFAAYFMVML